MLEAHFELPLAWWEREKEVGIVAIELVHMLGLGTCFVYNL